MARVKFGCFGFAMALALTTVNASAVTVFFNKLNNLTGANGGTAVYRADLNSLGGTFQAITILDNSSQLGGSPGQFSGFDLDAIKLSYTACLDAACAAGAAGLSVFDFVAGSIFTPGSQRPAVDPKLFGTGPAGNTVNNTVATLGAFDAFSSVTNTANGFLSLGDNGQLSLNLSQVLSTANLYLYIGEVGDNGEVAASTVTLLGSPVPGGPGAIPEPATWAMMLAGFGLVGSAMRRRQRANLRIA